MNLRALLCAVLLAWCGAVWAQALETLTLRHRTADQIMPVLQPLLDPGGSLAGAGNKLFVRTSARNLADLRRVLDSLDQPLRRLMISVRHGGELVGQAGGAELAGRVGTGGAEVGARAYSSRSSREENLVQQVQTVEGARAFINVGQSLPLPLQQVVLTPAGAVVSRTVVFQELGTGFHAEPRLAGDRVTLDISPRHDTPGPVPGSANLQRLSTTVSGRLGEWLPLGGSVQDTAGEQAGTVHYGTRNARDTRRIWLKVDELP